MHLKFAKEVGFVRYVFRRLLWRVLVAFRDEIMFSLPSGSSIPLPRGSPFASDVFVTGANTDWNSECLLAAYLSSFANAGDFIDVGANIGYYSAYMSPLARNCYAFEPDIRNLPLLRRTASLLSNVTVIDQAIQDSKGVIHLDVSSAPDLTHVIHAAHSPGVQTATATTIDCFCAENPHVSPLAVKIDIEGFDILALEGAAEVARKHKPVFLIEFAIEDQRPNSWERLARFVQQNDYTVYAIAREDPSAFEYRFELHQPDFIALPKLFTKMLFLVPLSTDFFSVLRRGNGAGSKAFRPSAARAFLREHR